MFFNKNLNISNPIFPIKIINNYNINSECSYINCALQALINLDCIKYWIKLLNINNYNNIMNNIQTSLTKEFYQLFIAFLSPQQKQIDSTNIIFHFENKTKNMYLKEISKDPYHFLFYFLEIIHYENNAPKNNNYNINLYKNQTIENMRNDQIMLMKYCDYFCQTQNSIISDYFFNTEKYLFKCDICPKTYYYWYKKIFLFNIDKFKKYRDEKEPFKANQNITLDDCFLCYQGGNVSMCPNCGNFNAYDYRKIFTSSKVIIIALKRYNHTFKGDLSFTFNFSISNYVIQNENNNMNYTLKACIYAYYFNNNIKYFSDIWINNNWYRFLDNDKKQINTYELYQYEPQVLIYELINDQSKYVNPFYIKANQMNQNNFIIPNAAQQMIFQMKQLQMMNLMQIMQRNLMLNRFNIHVNNNNINNDENINSPYIMLKFLIIPDDWDNDEENALRILPQVTLDDTIEKAIDNFFIKLQKPRHAIIKFMFNEMQIQPNSQQKLSDLGINENSVIYALRANNFDSLKCI